MSRMGAYTLLKHYKSGKCERKYSRTTTHAIYKEITFMRYDDGINLLKYKDWLVEFNKNTVVAVFKPGYNFWLCSKLKLKERITVCLLSLNIAEIDRLFREI